MRSEDLSGVDAEVYRAIAELEDRNGAPYLQDIAGHVGRDTDEVRAAVHRLTAERGLVHEVDGAGEPDLGPVYELSPRT